MVSSETLAKDVAERVLEALKGRAMDSRRVRYRCTLQTAEVHSLTLEEQQQLDMVLLKLWLDSVDVTKTTSDGRRRDSKAWPHRLRKLLREYAIATVSIKVAQAIGLRYVTALEKAMEPLEESCGPSSLAEVLGITLSILSAHIQGGLPLSLKGALK